MNTGNNSLAGGAGFIIALFIGMFVAEMEVGDVPQHKR
jgi:hypothetical protein